MRKVLITIATLLLISCSNHPPEINLSCTGYINNLTVYNGQISERKEPKIVSFRAKAYPPIEKNKNPYDVRIESDTYDSKKVETTADFIKGETTNNLMNRGKEDEYSFHLNRMTGVLQYSERQFISKSGQISRRFEGNCTKLENKI